MTHEHEIKPRETCIHCGETWIDLHECKVAPVTFGTGAAQRLQDLFSKLREAKHD